MAAVRLAAVTGLRIGEFLGIRWEHLDLESGRLTLPATKTGRRVHYLPAVAVAILNALPRIDVLKGHAIAISMDGKGRWVDNVFVERLWRSVKYEDVDLRAYETPTELRTGPARYFGFYNTKRRHSALDRRTPDAVYFDQAHRDLAA